MAVQAIRKFTKAEAFDHLKANPGLLAGSVSGMARIFGRSPNTVRCWAAEFREMADRQVAKMPKVIPDQTTVVEAPPVVLEFEAPVSRAPPPEPARPSTGVLVLASTLGATALGLACVGLLVNARFAAALGQTAEASLLLAAIGLAIDTLSMILPTVGATLWRTGRQLAGCTAWSIWGFCLIVTLIAATGFASTNIGDTITGRSRSADQARALTDRLVRLRAERAAIIEARAVATIDAAIQVVQPSAAAVWRRTGACSNVTAPDSGRACAPILHLREARGEAVRRDTLDHEVREAERAVTALPAVSAGDPGALMAADLVGWFTMGQLGLTQLDIQRMRIAGLAGIPALAGVLLALATMLWRGGK